MAVDRTRLGDLPRRSAVDGFATARAGAASTVRGQSPPPAGSGSPRSAAPSPAISTSPASRDSTPTSRNGYQGITVRFTVNGDAPAAKLREIVEQSRARSAVYDILTGRVPVVIEVDTD
jgi:hypothetical protein